jgi:tetratricopeptide (TPR) repeat protein
MDLCEVINAAIHHNNRGCALYRQGEKRKSRAAFEAACSILHQAVVWRLRADDEAMLRNAHNEAAMRYDDVDPEQEAGTGNTFVVEDHLPSSSRSEDGLLFANDAISLTPVVREESCSNPQCTCISSNSQRADASVRLIATTAAIVMNLALTFLRESELDAVHALALFERAFDLAINEPFTCYLSERVVLTSLNNAMQLQRELGDLERTKEYADMLIRLIHSLPFSFDEARRQFRRSCMLNAMVMMRPIVASAA